MFEGFPDPSSDDDPDVEPPPPLHWWEFILILVPVTFILASIYKAIMQ